MESNNLSANTQSQAAASDAHQNAECLATGIPLTSDPTFQYLLNKITQQEYHSELKYKIHAISKIMQFRREEAQNERTVIANLKKENDRLDKRQTEAVASCKYISQQVEDQMKVLIDRLSAEVISDARAMARQEKLEKQFEEIVELEKKLKDAQEKSKNIAEKIEDDKTVPSSQTPANVAAEFFFEAEARVKTAEAEVENIEQKIIENKTQISELEDSMNNKNSESGAIQKQRIAQQKASAEIESKITALEMQAAQLPEELAKYRQHGQQLKQQIDQFHNERVHSRFEDQSEIDEITQRLEIVQSSLLPESVRDNVENVHRLLVQLTDLSLAGMFQANGDSCSQIDVTISETETEESIN